MTPLQTDAWNRPFLEGTEGAPPLCEQPFRGWNVGLSINL
jgi:hypothetical protein